MAIELTLIRHGETTANAEGVWQGQGDADLSARGEAQARALGERLAGDEFDLVLSSDLVRTLHTSALAGLDPVEDAGWREMDIGVWEGLTRQQVGDRFAEEFEAIRVGEDVPMGGGETWQAFTARVETALDSLLERAPADGRIAVVAHGGVIHAVLAATLGFRGVRPWPIERTHNTAITRLVFNGAAPRLDVFNDATHTEWGLHPDAVGPMLALVRHGESEGNIAGQWHGLTDSPLSQRGHSQAIELAGWYGGVERVYASPLERARRTAEAFATSHGLDGPTVREDIAEIHFGAWEGLTTDEIRLHHPEDFEAVFHRSEDVPRGGTGETFAGAAERMRRAVGDVALRHPHGTTALFTHGGAIWALAADILTLGFAGMRRITLPHNTSVTHVRVGPDGPVLVDYNLRA
jgi:broad specificity phosphatase PhoE